MTGTENLQTFSIAFLPPSSDSAGEDRYMWMRASPPFVDTLKTAGATSVQTSAVPGRSPPSPVSERALESSPIVPRVRKSRFTDRRDAMRKRPTLDLALALFAMMMLVFFAASATASTTQPFHATFVEIGGVTPTGSCGSATVSQLGHVAHQCVVFDGCGPNCELRTITFDDGSTLVIHESIVNVISHWNLADPQFFVITLTIDGASSTGRLPGA